MGIEDPDQDVAEQRRDVDPAQDDEPELGGDLPAEAEAADVAEQRAVVPEDDDDR
jgi:hypothetical protein